MSAPARALKGHYAGYARAPGFQEFAPREPGLSYSMGRGLRAGVMTSLARQAGVATPLMDALSIAHLMGLDYRRETQEHGRAGFGPQSLMNSWRHLRAQGQFACAVVVGRIGSGPGLC